MRSQHVVGRLGLTPRGVLALSFGGSFEVFFVDGGEDMVALDHRALGAGGVVGQPHEYQRV